MNTTGAVRRIWEKFEGADIVVEAGPAARELMPGPEIWARRRHPGLFGKLGRVLAYRRSRFDRAIVLDDSREKIRLAVLAGIPDVVGVARKAGAIGRAKILPFDPNGHDLFDSLRSILQEIGARPDVAPTLPLTQEHRARAAELAAEPGIGLFVGASEPAKCWHAERWAELAARLDSPYVLAGPGEEAVRAKVAASGEGIELPTLDVLTLAAVVERLDMLISADSGPAHIAGAVGAKSVILYGPTDPRRFHPWGDRWTSVRNDAACDLYGGGCGHVAEPSRTTGTTDPRCPRTCMAAIQVEDVVSSIPNR